ncbi:hypothetical protein LT85_0026 [Collimonas arenae]|uniref:Uncharacterized protein n=1 Tax=Collimonas arenae TaxID=279058 RepID=A0A0A1F3R1_9BURK|nr:hypothetical protein LT85_0026 [Collimonas arenae]
MKTDPGIAESLLVPPKADTSRNVQGSVANWLNDEGVSCFDDT